MLEFNKLNEEAYWDALAKFGDDESRAFAYFAGKIIERFFQQTGRPQLSKEMVEEYCQVLWSICEDFGVPKPLKKGEQGKRKDLDPDDHSELLTQVLDQMDHPHARMELAILSNQFLKAILQPEFTSCCLSYGKKNEHGICERQNLTHCKRRISGAHCVDCPLFVYTPPTRHPKVLKAQWDKESREELEANLSVFLPEDYRRLIYFFHLHRRYSKERKT